jgi:hypothetical protein
MKNIYVGSETRPKRENPGFGGHRGGRSRY